jgi:hypothetical protein
VELALAPGSLVLVQESPAGWCPRVGPARAELAAAAAAARVSVAAPVLVVAWAELALALGLLVLVQAGPAGWSRRVGPVPARVDLVVAPAVLVLVAGRA